MNNGQNQNNQNNQNLESLNQNTPSSIGPANPGIPVQPVENLGSTTPPVSPIPPVESINLQPEGVVPPIPNNVQPVQNGLEPLMSTSLTPDTNMNSFTPQDQAQNMNNPMMQNQMNSQLQNPIGNMGMNQNVMPNNQINSQPQNPMTQNQMNSQPQNQMGNMGMNQNVMPNNQMNMMGGVPTPPPLPNDNQGKDSKKKANNKILLIILVVVLIIGIGYGVYYFLVASKNKTNIVINTIRAEVELGTDLELIASNFATVDGYDINSCTVNTNLDTSTYGTYQYMVTCGNVTTDSKTIIVRDTEAPVVTLKEVVVIPNAIVEVDDFLDSVEDASEYTATFDTDVDTSTPGTYEVNIIVSDEYQNATTVKGTLIVDENAPITYLVCTKDQTDENEGVINSYQFGISGSGNRYNTKKTVTFIYENEDTYKEAINEYEENKSINNVSGVAVFDISTLTIRITTNLEDSLLAEELGVDTIPTNEDEIQTIFDDSCEISLN